MQALYVEIQWAYIELRDHVWFTQNHWSSRY